MADDVRVREVVVNEVVFSVGKMPTMKQLHIFKRLSPLIGGFQNAEEGLAGILEAVAKLGDDDFDHVLYGTLEHCEFKYDGGWSPMVVGEGRSRTTASDFSLETLLTVAFHALKFNFEKSFPSLSKVVSVNLAAEGITPVSKQKNTTS